MKHSIANLYRATILVWQSSPRWNAISLLLLLFQGALPLGQLYAMKQLVDTLMRGVGSTELSVSLQSALLWIAVAGLLSLLGDACSALLRFAQTIQTEAVSDRIHSLLHAKSIAVDLAYYENTDYHNTFHRAQEEATYRPQMVLSGLMALGQSGLSLAGILALLTALQWTIPALLILATIPGIWIRFKYTGRAYGRAISWTERERQSYYFHTLLTTAPHAKEMRLFNLGNFFMRGYRTLRASIVTEKIQLARQHSTIAFITNASATVAVLIACGIIAQQTVVGAISLGGFVMYYQAFQRGQGMMRDLMTSSIDLYENSLFLQEFYRFLDLQPQIISPPQPQILPATWQTGLSLENVSFDYALSQRSVLKNINFSIQPGETIAIVGANGAGKSTLIKLICRLYDPTGGKIALDGVDLRDYAPIEWQRQLSVLFQDYDRYQLTVRENIELGNIDAAPSLERVWQAARAAGAERTIDRLPQGMDTRLGNWFEAGEELSIGQWQKIALARAFLRDARLIILDEPTSALDPQAEAEVFDRFRALVADRMAIVISHRLSTIKLVDRILVLVDGEIAESGSHEQLMLKNGHYAKLFTTQAQNYWIDR